MQCQGDKGALVLVVNICFFHHLWGCDQGSYGKFWERVTMALEFTPLSFISQGQKCLVFMFGEEKGAMANLLTTSQVEQHAQEHYRH